MSAGVRMSGASAIICAEESQRRTSRRTSLASYAASSSLVPLSKPVQQATTSVDSGLWIALKSSSKSIQYEGEYGGEGGTCFVSTERR